MFTFSNKLALLLALLISSNLPAHANDWAAGVQYQWLLGNDGMANNGWQLQFTEQSPISWQQPLQKTTWQHTRQITIPLQTIRLNDAEPLKVNGRVVQQVTLLLCGITAIAVTVRAVIGKDNND